jgi:hypothetical protein
LNRSASFQLTRLNIPLLGDRGLGQRDSDAQQDQGGHLKHRLGHPTATLWSPWFLYVYCERNLAVVPCPFWTMIYETPFALGDALSLRLACQLSTNRRRDQTTNSLDLSIHTRSTSTSPVARLFFTSNCIQTPYCKGTSSDYARWDPFHRGFPPTIPLLPVDLRREDKPLSSAVPFYTIRAR